MLSWHAAASSSWAWPVPGAVAVAMALLVAVAACALRKKRRLEGSYQPSAQERQQTRTTGPERAGPALPLPKEERLI